MIISYTIFLLLGFLLGIVVFGIFRLSIDAGLFLGLFLFSDSLLFILSKVLPDYKSLLIIFLFFIGATISLVLLFPYRTFKGLNERGVFYWTLFLLYILLSLIWSSNREYGYFKLLLFLVKGYFPGIVVFIVFKIFKKFAYRSLIFWGVIYSIVLLIYGTYEYPGRISLPGQNPIWTARSLILFITILLLHQEKSRLLVIWKIVLLCCSIYLFSKTQSRGPLVAFIFTWAYYMINKLIGTKNSGLFRVKLSKTILTFMFLISFFAMTVMLLSFNQSSIFNGNNRFAVLTNKNLLSEDQNFVSREIMWKEALNKFYNSPFLGVGAGGYSFSGIDYPHNLLLEIMSEFGIIGLILWGISLCSSFEATKGDLMMQMLFLETIFFSLFSGDLGGNYEHVIIGLAALAKRQKV